VKTVYISILAIFLTLISFAQNLVPNSSFEKFVGCPDYFGEMQKRVRSWNQPTNGTPDLYTKCGWKWVSVPKNIYGNVHPKSGDSYVGMNMLFSGSLDSEYIQVKLSQQLLKDSIYCLKYG